MARHRATSRTRYRVTPVTKRKVRQAKKRATLRISSRKIEAKRVVSQRGRTGVMEAALPDMPQQPQKLLLDSTAIRKFRYTIDNEKLRIWFVEGGVYDYFHVPESVVMILAGAQSKGRYFYYNIRTSYEFERIR